MKDDYPKPLKKWTSFFVLNPVSFNRQSYQKQKDPGTNEQFALYVMKQVHKCFFISYILPDQVW